MRKGVDILLLCLSLVFYLLMAASILLVPRQQIEHVTWLNALWQIPHVIGIAFWTGLAGGILFQIILGCRRRAWLKKHDTRRVSEFRDRIGLLSPCRTVLGSLADGLCVASLISFIVLCEKTNRESYQCFVALAVFVFTLCLHCIFNGNIFYYVRYQNRRSESDK